MPITVNIIAETAAELANEVQCLAQALGGQIVNVEAPAGKIEDGAAKPEPKKAAPRGKKAAAAEEKPVVPAFLQTKKDPADPKPYSVYKADGTKFSDFADPTKALDRLLKDINACEDSKTLQALSENNVSLIDSLEPDLQETYQDALDDRFAELQNAEEGPSTKEVTFGDAEAALKGFVKAVGLVAAKELMEKQFGTSRIRELKPENYGTLVDLIAKAA